MIDESLRRAREAVCRAHMTEENAHRFPEAIGRFDHARYEIVATGETYDGPAEVARLMRENETAFPDFHFEPERLHHADDAIVVEGTFTGTQDGVWRGLPPTGRRVEFEMLIVFSFEGTAMLGERIYFDLGTALRQLGVARDPNSTAGRITTVLNHPLTIGRSLLRARRTEDRVVNRDGTSRPPGRLGPPVIGETPALLRDPFRFLEERHRRYGDVFVSNVLRHDVVFLSGIEGAEAFYDAENITRSDAHPFTFVDLFGGINMEMYDGERHLALKSMALEAFDHDAIAGYLPDLEALISSRLERLARMQEFRAIDELRTLAIEAICRNILGLAPGPETDAVTREYADVLKGLVALPIPVPGTTYHRARQARDRILQRLRGVIAARRAHPGTDGLSRILGATTPEGHRYTDDEALLEAHHVVIAGFIVYALMGEVLRRLAERPDLRQRCLDEVSAHVGDGPLTMDALAELPTSTTVVLESKRLVPLVPLAFGRARRTFECGGFVVPAGWRVWLALHLVNHDPRIYDRPFEFDPERFSPGRAEHRAHPLAFIPQGAEPPTGHRCLGLDYSTSVTLAFLALLVRGYGWELPPQDLTYDRRKAPPEPRDGLRVRLTERR